MLQETVSFRYHWVQSVLVLIRHPISVVDVSPSSIGGDEYGPLTY